MPSPVRRPGGCRAGAGRPGNDGRLNHGRDRSGTGLRVARGRAKVALDSYRMVARAQSMNDSTSDLSPLRLSAARRVDERCTRFEVAWKAAGPQGQAPRIED